MAMLPLEPLKFMTCYVCQREREREYEKRSSKVPSIAV